MTVLAVAWPSHRAECLDREKLCSVFGLAVQAGLPISYLGTLLARPLRSTGITPLPRYYGPVRLPAWAQPQVMFSPMPIRRATHTAHPGLPGSSVDLCARAVPNHPGKPDDCSRSFLHRRLRASSNLADWPLPLLRNGAESGSLSLRLTRSLPGAPPPGSLRTTSGSLPVVRAIDRATSFQITRSTRLCLAHQMTPMAADHCRTMVSSFEFAVDPSFHNLIENEFGESGLTVAAAREICGICGF